MAIAIAAGHWSKSSRRGGRIAWASMVGIVTTANLAKYRVSARYRGDELFASQSRSRLRRRRGRKAGCSRECTGPADAARSANNGYSVGGAVRVGRVLEELGYWWFEEPVQHYRVKAIGEVSRRLDITVSAGEQPYRADSDIGKASMISASAPTSGAMPVSRLSLKADLTVIERQSFTASCRPRRRRRARSSC